MADPSATTPSGTTPDALSLALRQLLEPLARLALARGLTHATLDELLKQALVRAADDQLQALPPHRRASRVTTTTGIHRREVTRLLQELRDGGSEPPQRSHASELFTHWRSHAEYCDLRGSPRELPRQGPCPSFESLAQCITRDVHPRSLLDELVRLGLAALDAERDTVRLVRDSFVPQGDSGRMLRTLGNNVGSHLQAAVDNVLVDNRRHFEQAAFAQGLSEQSIAEFRVQVQGLWQQLIDGLLPSLEAMIARDEQAAPGQPRHRVRLGLYTFQQAEPDTPPAPVQPALSRARKTP